MYDILAIIIQFRVDPYERWLSLILFVLKLIKKKVAGNDHPS